MLSVFKKKKRISQKDIREIVAVEFDEQFYKTNYDFLVTDLEPLDHFLEIGCKDGLNPNEWFSVNDYLNENPDVAATGVNPFFHYLYYGKKENRSIGVNSENTVLTSLRQLVPLADEVDDIEFDDSRYFKEAKKILEAKVFDTKKWLKWGKALPKIESPHPSIKSFLEVAAGTPKGNEALLVGWVIHQPNSILWVEDEDGNPFFFDKSYRKFRQDVYDAFLEDMINSITDTGFLLKLTGIKPGSPVFIKALSSQGSHDVASIQLTTVESNPKSLAEWLFTVDSPMSELPERFTKIDWPIIEEMIAERHASISHMPVKVTEYGQNESIEVSMVIPLYGRIDFIEGQMVSFVQDGFISQKCELIYVIDDPALVEPIKELAKNLYQLYQVPFKVIFGGANRGFSGANNLGAENARGKHLLFMNSDVFPQKTGWLQQMVETLEQNPNLGVIAPRLLFADGSIQHAGMEFRFRSDLGVWINHHPNMGLDPALDQYKELTVLPAVTGACMLISREDFDEIGGWDTGYLIGDFEDSDFCLKLQTAGKECGYLPTVELTHLERQSFGLTGTPDFRTKVVILNATRHQNRWLQLIEKHANNTQNRRAN